jgi:hypothetical protein
MSEERKSPQVGYKPYWSVVVLGFCVLALAFYLSSATEPPGDFSILKIISAGIIFLGLVLPLFKREFS